MKIYILLILALVFSMSVVQAQLITSGITAASSSNFNGNYAFGKTIDGSGLNTAVSPAEHENGSTIGWLSGENNVANEWIEWDLGQSYTLDSVRVWNFNQTSVNPDWRLASIQQLDIYVSSNAAPGDQQGDGAANWTLWAENATFAAASGANDYTGFDLETVVGSALPTGIRYIRFAIDSNYDTPPRNAVGLSEIQFVAVPEPSSFALIAACFGFSWMMFSRRQHP